MKGKLITGVLYDGTPERWNWIAEELSGSWGEMERCSPSYPFLWTAYYQEIGTSLYRRFVSFAGLSEGSMLWKRKTEAIAMEGRSGSPRRVNIDPGILDGARLILASTKDRAQRIPISEHLYAEVTLRYKGKRWLPFDYTFPDFTEETYYPFLEEVRRDALRGLKEKKTKETCV